MNKENVFVWNNSAVTNAVIKKLEEDSNIKNIYCSDRNIINLSKSTIALKSDGISLLKELKEKQVKYVFSNTEANEKGFIDYSLKYKFSGLGANYKSLKLESSKAFSKIMMQKYDIKTADFVIVNNRNQLQQALNQIGLPCYIKADGYARSISAIKIYKEQDFFLIAEKYLNGYFYGNSIIIVEKEISGQEISIPCIVDGKNIKMIAAVKDYKRRNNNDLGSNTGGMGSICL